VEDGVSIEVKNRNMSQRYVAEIEYINHDCDLALLAVEDQSFFARAQPIEIGQMPEAHTKIEVYGYPVGGETMSVTAGIISRIEMGIYAHSMQRLLIAQIDAAINAGNSGGPVLAGNQLVGIATQTLHDAENVGYMIPVSVVRHFIEDIQDGHVDGFPSLGVKVRELDSPALRESLGMSGSQTGVLVAWVDHGSPADGSLKPRDVLLETEGLPIANDGTVAWPYVGRVHFSEVFRSRQVGERITVRVLRDGEVLQQAITLTRRPRLVPGRRLSELPQYFVFGGLLLQPLTADYLAYFEETPHDLGNYYYHRNRVTAARKQIILIQKVLPHPVNRG
jgi:S1-C subfamily serine protease